VELLTFPCPACKLPLRYDFDQVGQPFLCPACGTRGTLPEPELLPHHEKGRPPEEEQFQAGPAQPGLELLGGLAASPPEMPVEQELLHDLALKRLRKRGRAKAWRHVRRGLTLLLLSWLIVTVLATLVLMGVIFNCLKVLFQPEGSSPGIAAVGVLGVILVVAESVALYGYRLCMAAPPEEGIRDWAAVALGLTAFRNLACLGTSILYLARTAEIDRTLSIITILAAGLFFGQWFVALLLLRAVAYAQQSFALIRSAWNAVFLMIAVVLGWALLLCLFFGKAGGSEEGMMKLGLVERGWLRLFVGCGGPVLAFGLWLAFVWHLRLLNSLRGCVER
jgi:hypothetical protein